MWEPFCSAEITNIITITNINLQLRILMMLQEMVNVLQALSLSTEETGATKKYMRKITQQQHNSNNQKATICYCYSLDNNNQLRSGQRAREGVDAKFGFQFQLIFFFFSIQE